MILRYDLKSNKTKNDYKNWGFFSFKNILLFIFVNRFLKIC